MFETASDSGVSHRFRNLRGVQWRIDLGILPSAPSASVEDLRRVTANSRRRYAALRRQLLVDPHVPKDGSSSPDLVMDNPLSQNPDSMWGRFFKNAELERMVDQDLTRLYPERGSYFQTNACQCMLRRILLLWCLRHPEYGYRQGMHELLAPLLYVLNVDVERLSDVRKTYNDHFTDNFDGFVFHESDLTYKFDFKKFSGSMDHGDDRRNSSSKAGNLSELDPEIQMIVLLSDAYGAEGELGIVLSEKFMEHDAYCMFDALMGGAGGAVAMAEFFSPSPVGSSQTGFPPVIEASAALYRLLSIADSSLHSHLVELGVEPQYFALRWLRVLFGREFSLEDLLVIWDEIFTCENMKCSKAISADVESNFGILESPRGAFICALAVSMILNLRSSLLATENATTCLKRLLSFPDDVKLVKLLEKAKSLHPLALDSNNASLMPTYPGLYDRKKSVGVRGHSLSLDVSSSPKTPPSMVSDSYWEEKWRVLHKEEESKKGEQVPNRRKGWTERVKMHLSRTESAPSPSQGNGRTRIHKPSVRRSLLKDLERQLGLTEDKEDSTTCCSDLGPEDAQQQLGVNEDKENKENNDDNQQYSTEVSKEDMSENNSSSLSFAGSEENVPHFSYLSSPIHGNSDNENELDRRSSVASNSSIEENDAESSGAVSECLHICISDAADDLSLKGSQNDVSVGSECSTISVSDAAVGKSTTDAKDRRHILGKFQWLWKFGRNAGDEMSERMSAPEAAKACNGVSDDQNDTAVVSDGEACNGGSGDRSDTADVSTVDKCKGETVDQNVMFSLKNMGQSMLENIQVIESAFQQDRGSLENFSKNVLVGKGQVTAMAALTELRKISNLLSEM